MKKIIDFHNILKKVRYIYIMYSILIIYISIFFNRPFYYMYQISAEESDFENGDTEMVNVYEKYPVS